VIIALGVMAYLTAHGELPRWSPLALSIVVGLCAVPCFWAAKMWLGVSDAIILFIACGAYGLVEMAVANAAGANQPAFSIFGGIPVAVAIGWIILLLGAYAISASLFASRITRIVFATLTMVIFGVVLEQAAPPNVLAENASSYASNSFRRLLSGGVGVVLLEFLISRFKPLLPVPIQLVSSAFLIIFFGTVFAGFIGVLLPALTGSLLLFGMALAWHKFHYRFDDKIVLVDENNNPVSTASKLAAHNSDTSLHRAFSVFVFNPKGELLLQQRALSKKTWPGVWSNSCCGHVMMHEAPRDAAARRLKFELGLIGVELKIALPDFRYRAEKDGVVENEICPVLVGFTDGLPVPNPSEVASVRWVNWDEFLESVAAPENEISPWAVEEVQLLASSEAFTNWFTSRVPASGANGSVC
jgi:isopentenyl-diphosphate Delta-isomerase